MTRLSNADHQRGKIAMRAFMIAFLTTSLLPGLISEAPAHQGDRVYPIVELSDGDLAEIDLMDGSIEEWLDLLGEPALLAAFDFFTWEAYDYNPAEFDFRIWLGWHDATDRIYVAMEQVDDVYINEFVRDDEPYYRVMSKNDGSMVLHVDGDHSGGEFLYEMDVFDSPEEWMLHSEQQAQGYFALGEVNDDGSHVALFKDTTAPLVSFAGLEPWYALPPYADGGGGSLAGDPFLSVTEFYVTPFDQLIWNSPEESVVSELYPGKIIGLKFSIRDHDDEFGKTNGLFYLPEFNESVPPQTADSFGDFVLTGSDGSIPEITSVESKTWGRIKASFKE